MLKNSTKKALSLLLALVMLAAVLGTAGCGTTQDDQPGTDVGDVTPDAPDTPDTPDTPDEPENPDEEPGVPTDINMDSPYPVKRIDLYTTELSQYTIVYAQGADSRIVHAAGELASYLEQAAGYTLQVVTDDVTATANEILVGPTNRDTAAVVSRREALSNEGVMYYVENGKLYLDGNTALGVEYAVYHFLNDWIGWRCLSNHYEVIHEATYIRIPKTLDYSYSSPLVYRQTDWGINGTTSLKWGLNAYTDTAHTIIGFCHTMSALTGCAADTQPCLCNENVYNTVLANLRNWIEANPGCRWVSVTQNDNENYCECEACRTLAEKEGQSGIMLTFVNRLADAIKDDYPDVSLVTFAYRYTRQAPTTIVPRDNVIIWMCSIECCFSHGLDDPDCEENVDFCKDLKDWMAITDRIMFWDYTTNYHMYIMPFPDLMVIRQNAALLAENAVGIYEEGNYESESAGEFSELRAYLLSKLLWNPAMSEEEYLATMAEYCNDYYGPGGKYVYQFIIDTSAKVAEHHMGIYYCLSEDGCLYEKEGALIDYSFTNKMTKLWDKAEAAAETPEQLQHVQDCRLQQDFMQLLSDTIRTGVDAEATKAYLLKLKTLEKGGFTRYGENFEGAYFRTVDWLIETKTGTNPRVWRH